MIKLCKIIMEWYEKKIKKEQIENEKNELKFYSLAPVKNIDDIHYIKTLKWAIDEKDVTNIALSGAYGSGKSSILKSFENEYSYLDNYKILNISLATFKENGLENDNNENNEIKKDIEEEKVSNKNEIDIKLIEKSILQQMFYKVSDKEIPNSRFKRIRSIKDITLKTIILSAWFISVIELFSPFTFIYYLFDVKNFLMLTFLFSFIFSTGIFAFLYFFIKKSGNIKLQKLSLQAPEIDLSENSNNLSVLNEHIDEIIYFFEVTQYNILVIEDIDRFDNTEIFIKLRELNKLLNSSNQIMKNNPKAKETGIIFIYAIRDNIFINKERTKFFDFLIPVIPVINFSNSYTKLKEMFNSIIIEIKEGKENKTLLDEMDQQFLKDISLFIDDMRFLKNVFNEFLQYREKLEKIENLSLDKLFAIIIYKNYKPADFEKLHVKEGLIYNLFTIENKNLIVNKIISNLRIKEKEFENKLTNIENEKFNNLLELKTFYISKILTKQQNLRSFYLNNRQIQIYEIIRDSDFNLLFTAGKYKYYNLTGGFENSTFTFQDIEKEINPDKTYLERVKIIEEKNERTEQELKIELFNIQQEIKRIKTLEIQGLITFTSKNAVLEKEIHEDELLSYLIRFGYIDKHYKNYISYFYDGDEKIEDLNFLHSVLNDKEIFPYNYKLTNIPNLLKDIRIESYSSKSILNFYLINHLIENKNDYKENLRNVIKTLINYDNEFDFIKEYMEWENTKEKKSQLLTEIISYQKDFWDDFIDDNSVEKDSFFRLLVDCQDESLITLLNKNSEDGVVRYLEDKGNDEFFKSFIDNIDFRNIIKHFNINFSSLPNCEISNELYNYLVENWHFKLNKANLESILINRYLVDPRNIKIFSLEILETINDELTRFINKHIDDYVLNIYFKIKELNKEEKGIIKLINHIALNPLLKSDIINSMKIKINDLSLINNEDKYLLLKSYKTETSWYNLLDYYYTKKFDEEVFINYLSNAEVCKTLSKHILTNEELNNKHDDSFEKITDFILYHITLPDESYNYLLTAMKDTISIERIDIENFSMPIILKMIELQIVEINKETFSSVEFINKVAAIKLLESKPDDITTNFSSFVNNTYYFKAIVKSSKFSVENKINIINTFANDLEIKDDEDFYKEIFNNLIKENIKKINDTVYLFFIKLKLSKDDKLKLFVDIEDKNISVELIDETLLSLGGRYRYLKNINAGNEVFPKEPLIEQFLNKLDRLNYISSVSKKNDHQLRANLYGSRKRLKY